MALQSLREQWQRAILSALGIMVGCVAIVLLVSIAKGVQADVTGQVQDIGVNVLIVVPGRVDDGMFNPNIGGNSYLKEEDATRLLNVPGVVRVAPLTFVGGGVRVGKKAAYSTLLIAAPPEWFQMHKSNLQSGRVFTEADRDKNVIVMGSIAKDALFGKEEALGKTAEINGHTYTIAGITEDKKSEQSLFSMGSFQNVVYIPYAAFKRVEPDAQTHRIMVQTRPEIDPKTLKKSIDAELGTRLDHQQYSVLTQEDLLGLVYRLMSILTWLLTGLTSIALFVGGVGIMAIMLMSVGERAKEIGVRKTLGATKRDIFIQFLTEAVFLALSGGIVGLLFSYVVCIGLYYYTPVKPMITPGIIALGFGVCTGIGAIFGLIPAMKAAKQDPVVALRME
ncbi:MAG: ABC transporter permease [Fimbriimonas sp.]